MMIRLGIKNIMAVYETFTLVALTAVFLPALFAGTLLEGVQVPIHFNVAGRVDGWGDKGSFIELSIVALIIYVSFTFLQRRELRRSNTAYSIMLRLLKLLIVVTLAYINITSYAVVKGWAVGLNVLFIWVLVVAMIVVSLYYSILVKIIKKRI